MDVDQFVSNNIDEEIDNLYNFFKILMKSDIISGHNILGFDNTQIYNRIKWKIKNYKESISKEKKDVFVRSVLSERDKMYFVVFAHRKVWMQTDCRIVIVWDLVRISCFDRAEEESCTILTGKS